MTSSDISTSLAPFIHLSRSQWSALASTTPLPLTNEDVARLSSLGDPIDLTEVDRIYRPLTALVHHYVRATQDRHRRISTFLGRSDQRVPFVIAIAGSVAAGKSTVARLLKELLSRWPSTPNVELVTTDGFLYPNDVLTKRDLMDRKGFPESYDRRAFLEFVQAIKAGIPTISAPLYDHVTYDIVPGKVQTVSSPDILIIEGLNVLQPARVGAAGDMEAVSDYFDMSIYVDADAGDIENWYINRFHTLKKTAFTDPLSYFARYATLTEDRADETARHIWRTVNLPNLLDNIEPTRTRATVILSKRADHRIESVYLRKP